MFDLYQARLQKLSTPESFPLLTRIQRGIEKEGLRVTPMAEIAQTVHPKALGSALMHHSITTDYSEALLEFITPVSQQVTDCIDYLSDLHSFTQQQLVDEYIWPASMPCQLAGDESIPIAEYGNSNIGKMKHVYRQGLSYRYGRTMQSIAGIHYNFSMPDEFWPHWQQIHGDNGNVQLFKSQCYFDLIRNFRRHSWMLIYLFGASPVLDSSFMREEPHELDKLTKNTVGLPFATSLRMSDLGYQSKAQAKLEISYNNLDSYIENMTQAIQHHYPDYENIGVNNDGTQRQLNANILQLENEYYSEIRPKRVTKPGETPVTALKEGGVEYIEVRILDTNPLLPVGIDAQQIRFLDIFLLYCLLSDSPELTQKENEEIKGNQQKIILEGRKAGLGLHLKGRSVDFQITAKQLLAEMAPIATLLDQAHKMRPNDSLNEDHKAHIQTLLAQSDKVENSALTPSGIIMRATESGNEFIELMLAQAKKHQVHFTERGLSAEIEAQLQQAAMESIQQQQELEASDEIPSESFLQK